MSEGEMNSNGKPWLGGLYQKFEKMYDDIDHSSQDTVKFARSQLQTVGENVKKLGSHVMFDLPFQSFLPSKSNSAPPLARKTIIKPKLSINVIDLEYPADAKTEHIDVGEVRTSDLNSKLIDDHWSPENLEDDSEVENETRIQLPSSPEVSDSAHSDGKNVTISSLYNDFNGSSLPSSLSIMDQESEMEIKDKMPSAEVDDGESWADELFTRPFQLTTESDLPRSAELFFDHAVECAPNVSIICQSEPTNHVSIFSSNSSLEESLNLVEASHSALIQTDRKTCEDYFDTSGNVISSRAIPPLDCPPINVISSRAIPPLDCPPIQQPNSYFSVDNSASSCTSTSTFEIAGQSDNSVGVFEDLPMEKVELSDKDEQNNLSDKVDRIQISDKVDRIQRGVSVTKDINFSMSSRRGCFNPYKKMFQNPFSSKKRLEKDYKLLSVWYGDIDTELSEITPSKETTLEYKGVVDDTEWEIV